MGTVSYFFCLLARQCVLLLVLCNSRCPCACFRPLWAVRIGKVRHSYTFWSRVIGWRRVEMGTFYDLFRLLGRIWVFLLVL